MLIFEFHSHVSKAGTTIAFATRVLCTDSANCQFVQHTPCILRYITGQIWVMLGAMKWTLLFKSTDLETGMKHSLHWNDEQWHCAASPMHNALYTDVQQKFDMCLQFSIATCDTLVLLVWPFFVSWHSFWDTFLCIFLKFRRKLVLFQSLFCVVGTYLNCEKQLLGLSCLSAHMEQLGSHWTYFLEIWYWNIFQKSVEKIQILLKSDKNNWYFTCRLVYIYVSCSFLLRMRDISDSKL